MATASTSQKKPCSKCDKGAGIFTCDGCQQSFCRKHSDEHRQELAIEMDIVGQEHDILQRDIDSDDNSHPLLVRIDAWEREICQKIKQVAEQARVDLKEMINLKKQKLKTTIGGLTNELQASRESEDYTELDLKRWIEQLNQLRQDIDQSINTYRVDDDDDQRSAIRLIKVRNLSTQSTRTFDQYSQNDQNTIIDNGEKFSKGDNQINTSEKDLVATHSGPRLSRSSIIFGYNRYSVGRYKIRFRIDQMTGNLFFIGIVTLSQMDPSTVFYSTTTTYGWWPAHGVIHHGESQHNSPTIEICQGELLSVILDCDNKSIYFNHQRLNQTLQLPIDIKKCPLPWKLVFALGEVGNTIRIIP